MPPPVGTLKEVNELKMAIGNRGISSISRYEAPIYYKKTNYVMGTYPDSMDHRSQMHMSPQSGPHYLYSLEKILSENGLFFSTSTNREIRPPRAGYTRMFRAESGRGPSLQIDTPYSGWQLQTPTHGQFFTTDIAEFLRYSSPTYAPAGAALRWVDVPDEIARQCSFANDEFRRSIEAEGGHLPGDPAVYSYEFFLPEEWANRAQELPEFVRHRSMFEGQSPYFTHGFTAGYEILQPALSNRLPVQLMVRFVESPRLSIEEDVTPESWTRPHPHRLYVGASLACPTDDQSIYWAEIGTGIRDRMSFLDLSDYANQTFFGQAKGLFGILAKQKFKFIVGGQFAQVLQGKWDANDGLEQNKLHILAEASQIGEIEYVLQQEFEFRNLHLKRNGLRLEGSAPWMDVSIVGVDDANFASLEAQCSTEALGYDDREQVVRILPGQPTMKDAILNGIRARAAQKGLI